MIAVINSTLSAARSTAEHYAPKPYYEIDTAFIAAQHWPLALIELALSRGVEEHKLLRGTGIFCEDIARNNLQLSPQQCFQLIHNVQKHSAQPDLSFLLGHRLLLDNTEAATVILANAHSLQDALDTLIAHPQLLSPFIAPRLSYEQNRLVIYWQDACGADSAQIFLLEMMATALSSLSRWQTGTSLPWQFYFTHSAPAYIEQYQVHLHTQCYSNSKVQFNAPVNAMAIERSHLHLPWKKSNPELATNARTAMTLNAPAMQQGFLAETYNYLHNNIQHAPNLEQTAADFSMSSASFKRKLKKHYSHFQAQYDLVRRDLAIKWLNQGGWTHEQVAQELHFYDAANLRRAFKKWTGKLPQAMAPLD